MKTKLLQQINGELTGRKTSFRNNISSVSFRKLESTPRFELNSGSEYVVEVKLGAAEFISDELLHDSKSKEYVLELTKQRIGRSIAKYVYGDIQSKMIDVLDHARFTHTNDKELLDMLYQIVEMMDYD